MSHLPKCRRLHVDVFEAERRDQQVKRRARGCYAETESGLTQLVPPKRTPGWASFKITQPPRYAACATFRFLLILLAARRHPNTVTVHNSKLSRKFWHYRLRL